MTRGRFPKKALDAALPKAKLRGVVLLFRQEDEYAADFEILCADRVVIVRVKRTRRLHCSVSEIEEQCTGQILRFRSLQAPLVLCRELWVWSVHGTFRFFRVENTCITEIDQDGGQLVVAVPGLNGGSKTGS